MRFCIHMLLFHYGSWYIPVKTHFTVIMCFNASQGLVNKGHVYIMYDNNYLAVSFEYYIETHNTQSSVF